MSTLTLSSMIKLKTSTSAEDHIHRIRNTLDNLGLDLVHVGFRALKIGYTLVHFYTEPKKR